MANHELLAQFPLELVVFPGETLPLHIFEPRYRDLIRDCPIFGIAPVIDGKLQKMGTVVEVTKIAQKYDDGRLDVITRGLSVYEIHSFRQKTAETTYGMAEVDHLEDVGSLDPMEQTKIFELISEMFSLMRIPKKASYDSDDDPYTLGHKIGMTIEEEYQLLEIRDLQQRQAFILEKLARVLPKVKELDQIRRQIEMNGHFRNIIPPKI